MYRTLLVFQIGPKKNLDHKCIQPKDGPDIRPFYIRFPAGCHDLYPAGYPALPDIENIYSIYQIMGKTHPKLRNLISSRHLNYIDYNNGYGYGNKWPHISDSLIKVHCMLYMMVTQKKSRLSNLFNMQNVNNKK